MNPVKFSALTGIMAVVTIMCLFLSSDVSVSAQTSNISTVYSNSTIDMLPSFNNQTTSSVIPDASVIQELVNTKQILTDMIVKHRTSNIPIFTTWVDRQNSTLVVGIEDNATLPLSAYRDKLTAIVGNIPMKVRFGHFIEQSCTSKISQCDPLIGGIQVEAPFNSTFNAHGTLNIGATDNLGRKGFITASHVVGNGTGQNVGQPGLSNRTAGQVLTNPSLSGTRYSDSAFIQTSIYSADPTKIYRGTGQTYNVINEVPSTQTPYSTTVYMMGVTTGLSRGVF